MTFLKRSYLIRSKIEKKRQSSFERSDKRIASKKIDIRMEHKITRMNMTMTDFPKYIIFSLSGSCDIMRNKREFSYEPFWR